ncbi:MAG: hypothetical protein DCC59_05440 [Chloroflexi bacterium]|nr:MAG: hypothetical protein DCC59_05440 [Chloroflexota bacterium]
MIEHAFADQRRDERSPQNAQVGLHRVIVAAHTDEDDVIRIISARKATKHEEKPYFKEIGN